MKTLQTLLLSVTFALSAGLAQADEDVFTLTIKDHQFTPSTLEVPAGKKLKLVVKNLDATPEEFESDALHREKVIPGGKEAVIAIGPLKPGSYAFKGEFHAKTAQGAVVAK